MTSTSEGAESGAVAETTYVNEFGAEADAPVMREPRWCSRCHDVYDAADGACSSPAAGDRRRVEPIGGSSTDVRLTTDSVRPGASLPDADPEFAGDPLAAVRGIVHGVGTVVLIVGAVTLPLWFDWFVVAVADVLGMEVGR